MKNRLVPAFLLVLMGAGLFAGYAQNSSDRISLGDLKSSLKENSSDTQNESLATVVLNQGVSFEYTLKRENMLRKWGADEGLLHAVYRSILDDRDEETAYRKFADNHDSKDKAVRRSALEAGEAYLKRFGELKRFEDRAAFVKAELRFLQCEFDPSLGC